MAFNAETRKKNIERFAEEYFDLVIIGGGISGAGVARDACSRGMRVALIEASDFASGTSSRSSKLIHGGFRYLENLEFGLVFEALSERKILFEIAPHLVHPLKFFLPLYEQSRVSMFKLGLGMWFYDFLSQFEAPEIHSRFNETQTMKEVPILNSKQLCGSYAFYDAYMDDDRLVIETLRSSHALGAACANYVKAIGAKTIDGKIDAVMAKDLLTGKEILIRARHVVSTVGPWTDILGHELFKDWQNLLRPTKGVHLTFSRERLPVRDAVIMSDDVHNRIVFVIPRHEMVIVGTTDTDFKDNPSTVHTEKSDVDYLLGLLGEYFPGAKIEKKDIIASYAGVRPLVYDGSSTEGKTSREHTIIHDPRNITFVAGGKYTTYRRTSEQIVDEVLQLFPFEKKCLFSKNNTKVPINPKVTTAILEGLYAATAYFAKETNRSEADVKHMVERHGGEAIGLLGSDAKTIWEIEAEHAIESTMCLSIKDFYLRRSPLFLAYRGHGLEHLPKIEKIFTHKLNLNENQIKQQAQELSDHFSYELNWQKL